MTFLLDFRILRCSRFRTNEKYVFSPCLILSSFSASGVSLRILKCRAMSCFRGMSVEQSSRKSRRSWSRSLLRNGAGSNSLKMSAYRSIATLMTKAPVASSLSYISSKLFSAFRAGSPLDSRSLFGLVGGPRLIFVETSPPRFSFQLSLMPTRICLSNHSYKTSTLPFASCQQQLLPSGSEAHSLPHSCFDRL